MSHTTTIKSVAVRDIAALRASVAELQAEGVNCTLEEGENITPRMYFPRQADELRGKTPYVLRLHNVPYDVGFIKQEDGTFAPVMDTHAGYIQGQIGAKCGCKTDNGAESSTYAIGNMMQKYAKNAAINAALASGYTIENISVDATTGDIHIVADADSYNGY